MTLLIIKYFARNVPMLIVRIAAVKTIAINVSTIMFLSMESAYFPLCKHNTVIVNKIMLITQKAINITLTKIAIFNVLLDFTTKIKTAQ